MDTVDSELYKFACLVGRVGKLADALKEKDAPHLELSQISAFVENWMDDLRDDDPARGPHVESHGPGGDG